MQTVHDIMVPTVRAIHRDTNLCEAEGIFVTHEISGAPLVDDGGHLVGFVSKSDVTRFDTMGEDPSYAQVHEIANPRVITIEHTASIEEAAQKMLYEHVHHLVVIEKKTMVGVLSALDFVKLVANKTKEN